MERIFLPHRVSSDERSAKLVPKLSMRYIKLVNGVFIASLVFVALLVFVFGDTKLGQVAGWVFLAVFVFGGLLWYAASKEPAANEDRAKVWGELGRSLLVAGLLAFAVWGVAELRRPTEAHHALQLSLGAQQSMPGIDLHEEDLSSFDLSGKDLSGADLTGANLTGASLIETDLAGAELSGADLAEAKMRKANLAGATLDGARLEGVSADLVDLEGARLPEANLANAHLSGAKLQGACLSAASLTGARLPDAHLGGADLHGADLKGTRFWYDLRAAYMNSVGLQGARHATEALWPPKMRDRYRELVHPSGAGAPRAILLHARHEAEVRAVPDGDTVALNVQRPHRVQLLKARLIGIESPELEEEGGPAARAALLRLLPVGAHVTYQYDATREDEVGRQLLYVFGPDRRLVNQAMLEQGRATARLDPLGDRKALLYGRKLEEGEAWAREHALGMWATCPP